jgi:DNA-binding NtrC family response regulator
VGETTPIPSPGRPAATRRGGIEPATRALVIDGDQGTLAFAAEALSSFTPGLEVATARDLQQAGAWVESFRPHIILVSDSFAAEMLEHREMRLSGRPVARDCKIVLMSGHDGAGSACEIDPVSFDGVLPKPLQLQPLLTAVRDILKARDDH